MKFLILFVFLLPMLAFSEVIHFECKYFIKSDSWGNLGIEDSEGRKQIINSFGRKIDDSGSKSKIILDTEKMILTYLGSKHSCMISHDKDRYVCDDSIHNKKDGHFFFRHEINRRNLEYKFYSSITNKPNGEKDTYFDYLGSCKRQKDIQF